MFFPARRIFGAGARPGDSVAVRVQRSSHSRGVTAEVFRFGSGVAFEVTLPIGRADSALVFRVHQLDSFQMKLKPGDALQESI